MGGRILKLRGVEGGGFLLVQLSSKSASLKKSSPAFRSPVLMKNMVHPFPVFFPSQCAVPNILLERYDVFSHVSFTWAWISRDVMN